MGNCASFYCLLPQRAFNIQTTAGESQDAGSYIQQVSAVLMSTQNKYQPNLHARTSMKRWEGKNMGKMDERKSQLNSEITGSARSSAVKSETSHENML